MNLLGLTEMEINICRKNMLNEPLGCSVKPTGIHNGLTFSSKAPATLGSSGRGGEQKEKVMFCKPEQWTDLIIYTALSGGLFVAMVVGIIIFKMILSYIETSSIKRKVD